ncbi:MAG: SPOR domain-containing protein [Bacteroidales bacterium]|nr:SPOR domain-containing protein [Bacteroidales bacterium]
MKRYIITALASFAALLAFSPKSSAQALIPEGYELVDSVIFVQSATADSSYVGKNIFDIMPSRRKGGIADVVIQQDSLLKSAMRSHIYANSGKAIKGYRIRIFYDNGQNARAESTKAYNIATNQFHVSAYRGYTNPYFKVTIGDFRTKSDAQRMLEDIKGTFPTAFIVKEKIKLPSVWASQDYQADTIKVLRKITYFE